MQEFIEAFHNQSYKKASDFSVHNLGFEACTPGYKYGPRICPYHILHFVFKGRGALSINHTDLSVQEGEAFLIPADMIASYQASEKDPWQYAWAGFLGKSANNFVQQLVRSVPDHYVLKNLSTQKYRELIEEAAFLKDQTLTNYYISGGVLMRIMALISEEIGLKSETKEQISLTDEIRYYLDMKYSEKVTITEVASFFSIHPNYLTRIFRARFQISPKQYLVNLKMDKACRLLAETELSIGLIADSLGFADPFAFSKTFHRRFRMSPSQYRQGYSDLDVAH